MVENAGLGAGQFTSSLRHKLALRRPLDKHLVSLSLVALTCKEGITAALIMTRKAGDNVCKVRADTISLIPTNGDCRCC